MKLGERLQALADFVPEGSRVADIGTDHGYLAVELVQSGRAKFVVASDKNAGPYEAAVRTVRENGLTDDVISVRLGDGLQSLEPGEVDTVCIAGMGGALMIEILEGAPKVVNELTTLILQPQGAAAELRQWLYKKHWYIEDESLVLDDGRIYEIIKAKRGRHKMPEPLLLEIGPVLWKKKPPLLRHHIEALLFQERRVAAGMEKSEKARKSKKYQAVIRHIKELGEHLSW
ncbi:class I SAM-dependent methyltransferase [uncultured Mitsuokella sp.]|jgi:tRNA (adenine22-N1)-methyltransferase|uniref:tRNA (adenine(22)-N(1))-methyltransferase n=1 Tax=uncultured Mitsuokella sp. TaxID=453120 RepID=UPI0025D2C953|nr:class I SAM-dependent methyltransferase [uncultured Mitsuokella sp.]